MMKLSPLQSLLFLALTCMALLAAGFSWTYLHVKEIGQSMEGQVRLGQMTMQLQVVQNEVAAARQLVIQTGPDGSVNMAALAVARNRLQFADGVLQGLNSQAATPTFDEADRQSLTSLLALSRQLAGNGAIAAPSVPQLAQLQQALNRFAARLGRQGGVEARHSAQLRAIFEQGVAALALGGLMLLGLTAGYLALGWRRQYAQLRHRVQALAGRAPQGTEPGSAGRSYRALAGDLDAVEQRLTNLREAALQSVAAAEGAAAKLSGYAGQLADQTSAGLQPGDAQRGWDDRVEKLLRGLHGLATGLQAGQDKLREFQEIIGDELAEHGQEVPPRLPLAPALQSAGEKIEQLLLLCLNLRLSLLHGQAEPSHFAVVAEQLDPICAEGIDLARAIAAAGVSLEALGPATGVELREEARADTRLVLADLRESLARQIQAARAMAQFCGHLRGPVGAVKAGMSTDDLAARAMEIQALIGETQKGLHALRAAVGH